MLKLSLEVILAPLLVAASLLVSRRWGERLGGLVSALPAIAGPVLLIDAEQHGAPFAAKAAVGTLFGLVALSGFAAAYGWASLRVRWALCVAAGWMVAAGIAVLVASAPSSTPLAFGAACLSLAAAHAVLTGAGAGTRPVARLPSFELPLRMASTALLIVALVAVGDLLGPQLGGILVALPALASVLAAFTHARHGSTSVRELLRGMLQGMAGFAVFCALVALLAGRAGTAPTFLLAAAGALVTQASSAALFRPRPLAPAHHP